MSDGKTIEEAAGEVGVSRRTAYNDLDFAAAVWLDGIKEEAGKRFYRTVAELANHTLSLMDSFAESRCKVTVKRYRDKNGERVVETTETKDGGNATFYKLILDNFDRMQSLYESNKKDDSDVKRARRLFVVVKDREEKEAFRSFMGAKEAMERIEVQASQEGEAS
jgi:hypothetical protein